MRILIDVSGSMKQNDPRNLRVPALRLVTELLPEGVEAGVWLFAEKTEILAPPCKVDAKWKAQTRARLERIHSRGLFTNIEQAIATAIDGWDAPDEAGERHLVLLTDGLVDVSKEADQSAASRERILSTQIERLRALQVKVHGIALSDEVDAELMRALATQTDGWLESASDADALQRIFLHMMEQAAAPTTVPLEGNRFDIDERVSEFTLLAFTGEGGATILIAPDGTTISASQRPEGVVWRTEAGYDLVTLSNPTPGQWELQGVPDPDNRVVVATDLGIELSPLPSAPRYGESPRIETWLTDHGKPVTRKDLLGLVIATATLTPAANAPRPREEGEAPEQGESAAQPTELALELDAESGRFQTVLDTKTLAPGIHRLQVTLDGGTFKRQATKRLKIAGVPLSISYAQRNPSEETPSAALVATLNAEPDLIDPGSLSGYLLMRGPEGRESVIEIAKPTALPQVLTIPIERPGEYQIQGRLMARALTGENIDIEPETQRLAFEFVAPDGNADSERDSNAPTLSWLELSVYLLVGNALLGLMLGLTWWLLNRQRKKLAVAQTKLAAGKTA
ncbi:VWA domain-containing protein [Thiocystis violascens]|uniref:Uncharacterized protein containing a von Willebrand factor type A (VWA) domain n=1 Tax=Thiocystis violascens (strain ATCC 17096 / DSM 198 / 6111) TaxID=765911 RepID=I3Y830_THIV6|nr:vWA domain-containing protein [Thiocystis violascens]AFL73148.1 uncharacterized protein containing a von Willebrand factor type A (vWA) domain [Thiocystis violascens DSM 198]